LHSGFAHKLSAWLKTESTKSRKQRRTLKQIHEDLRELGFEGSYDRVAAFARQWKMGQMERVNSASKGTPLDAGDQQKVQDFIRDLAVHYSGGGIRSLECCILTDEEFAKHAHERYFRADYMVFGIDRGLDSFGGTVADRGSIVWRHDKTASNHFAQQESALQMNAFSVTQVI